MAAAPPAAPSWLAEGPSKPRAAPSTAATDNGLPAWMDPSRDHGDANIDAGGSDSHAAEADAAEALPALEGMSMGVSSDVDAPLLDRSGGWGGDSRNSDTEHDGWSSRAVPGHETTKRGVLERCWLACAALLITAWLALTIAVHWALFATALLTSCPEPARYRKYRIASLFFGGLFALVMLADFRRRKGRRFKWRWLWLPVAAAMALIMLTLVAVEGPSLAHMDTSQCLANGFSDECCEQFAGQPGGGEGEYGLPATLMPAGDSALVVAWTVMVVVLYRSRKGK